MNEILLGSAVFTGLVMALTLIVLGARTVVWGRERVHLTVNQDRVIEAALGEKLLGALEHGGVHLPTSCGGVGTCGLCRLQVSRANGEEGESILPIERANLSESDVAAGFRLACQVVVRGDLDITVPSDLLGVENWICTVRKTRTLSPLIKEIVIALPSGKSHGFQAGCYVTISAPRLSMSFSDFDICSEHKSTWQRLGLCDLHIESQTEQARAYSLANRPSDRDVLILNIRIALPPSANPDVPPGVVSSYLFSLKVGDSVEVTGPYRNFIIQDTDREIILIGGGVGMAPLFAHVYEQLEHLHSNRIISYWYGARSQADLYYTDEMERLAKEYGNFSWHTALSDPEPEDDWEGERGFIHDVVFSQYLSSHPAPQDCEYYLCGPPLMIKAVRTMLDKLGVSQDNVFYDDFGV